ncbi:FAD:protein FMN transferase [Oceaniferula spumae]|uniref:FAD:protein FMN transferase n=1 Tax=Oceaniferula spumae TaxID=2979115 RepID=A0AAT9FM10_9BACT
MAVRHLIACLLSVCAMVEVCAVEKNPALERYHFQAALMGTRFQIVLYGKDQETATKAANAAFAIGKEVEKACSDYDVTSELMTLMKPPASQKVSALLADVLEKSLAIAEETNGAFDPTLGGHSWNWRRARTREKLPTDEAIAAAIKISGWQHLTITKDKQVRKAIPGMKLDLGGIAKGYAADRMLEILRNNGIKRATVAAGGDVRLGDAPPNTNGWKVGLKTLASDPNEPQTRHPYLVLSNCAVSTSGDLHQFIEIDGLRYSHIVDPATGLGLTRRVSATVVALTATRSDALATACCVSPELAKSMLEKDGVEKLLVITHDPDSDLTQTSSANFPKIHQPKTVPVEK